MEGWGHTYYSLGTWGAHRGWRRRYVNVYMCTEMMHYYYVVKLRVVVETNLGDEEGALGMLVSLVRWMFFNTFEFMRAFESKKVSLGIYLSIS